MKYHASLAYSCGQFESTTKKPLPENMPDSPLLNISQSPVLLYHYNVVFHMQRAAILYHDFNSLFQKRCNEYHPLFTCLGLRRDIVSDVVRKRRPACTTPPTNHNIGNAYSHKRHLNNLKIMSHLSSKG